LTEKIPGGEEKLHRKKGERDGPCSMRGQPRRKEKNTPDEKGQRSQVVVSGKNVSESKKDVRKNCWGEKRFYEKKGERKKYDHVLKRAHRGMFSARKVEKREGKRLQQKEERTLDSQKKENLAEAKLARTRVILSQENCGGEKNSSHAIRVASHEVEVRQVLSRGSRRGKVSFQRRGGEGLSWIRTL